MYLETKFGGPGEVQAIHDRITVAGVSAGIEFAFGRIIRTPNTFDAHRLVWFAQQQGGRMPWWRRCSTATSRTG